MEASATALDRKIRKIAEYSERFVEKHLKGKIERRRFLQQDWYRALEFFFAISFYQGRRDKVSTKFRDCAYKVLESTLGDSLESKRSSIMKLKEAGNLDEEGWQRDDNPLCQSLKKGGVNKRGDRLMVISTLAFITTLDDWNIVNWAVNQIRNGNLRQAYECLDSEQKKIWSVGPKIAALFLRDIVTVFGLEDKVTDVDQIYLQPIDTWVRQVAVKLEMVQRGESAKKIRSVIVRDCLKCGVSPIAFNQGAWYVGTDSFNLLLEAM